MDAMANHQAAGLLRCRRPLTGAGSPPRKLWRISLKWYDHRAILGTRRLLALRGVLACAAPARRGRRQGEHPDEISTSSPPGSSASATALSRSRPEDHPSRGGPCWPDSTPERKVPLMAAPVIRPCVPALSGDFDDPAPRLTRIDITDLQRRCGEGITRGRGREKRGTARA
jgi:hypothetical protein